VAPVLAPRKTSNAEFGLNSPFLDIPSEQTVENEFDQLENFTGLLPADVELEFTLSEESWY